MVAAVLNDAPPLEFLFQLNARFGDAIEIRSPGAPGLDICYFISGNVAGPRLSGDLLCGGGDWAVYRTPDRLDIDARGVLRLAAGELVYLQYSGIWRAPTGVLSKLFAPGGFQYFVPAEHYIRVLARFRTASDRHSWLNGVLALGIGNLTSAGSIGYNFYEIT
jgi:Protein of unknown function (DUF3237)